MPTRITFVSGRGFDVEEDVEEVARRVSAEDSLLVRFDVSRGGRRSAVFLNPTQIVYFEGPSGRVHSTIASG